MRSADKQKIRFGDDPKVSFGLESHEWGKQHGGCYGKYFHEKFIKKKTVTCSATFADSTQSTKDFRAKSRAFSKLKGQRCFKIIRRLHHANPPSANHIRHNYISFHVNMSRIVWRQLLPYHVQRLPSRSFLSINFLELFTKFSADAHFFTLGAGLEGACKFFLPTNGHRDSMATSNH